MQRSKSETHQLVEDQYRKFPYPAPASSLDEFIRSGAFQGGCPSQYFHLYWPFRKKNLELDILVAGCGTMQAPKFAVNLPQARITAIDICEDSITHTRSLLKKHRISNVETHRLPIEEVGSLNRSFDLIMSTGVLHHLPEPEEGLRALESVLRDDGSMYLMLYGKYGRDGIYYMQDLLRRLGISASSVTTAELQAIRQFISTLPPYHPLVTKQFFFNNFQVGDEELVDLLLHPQDRGYSIPDILDYLDRCGMKLQSLLFRAHYALRCSPLHRSALAGHVEQLPETEQFAIGELYRAASLMHFFITCKKQRKENTYRIDLNGSGWKNLIPIRNPSLKLETDQTPPGHEAVAWSPMHQFRNIRYPLKREQINMLQQMDGHRNIGEIYTAAQLDDNQAREFFAAMYDYDFVSYRGASR